MKVRYVLLWPSFLQNVCSELSISFLNAFIHYDTLAKLYVIIVTSYNNGDQ